MAVDAGPTFVVRNEKLGERLTITGVAALVRHLLKRMQTRGHYVLSYDHVTVWSEGIEYTFRGDYVLLHALSEVPLPGFGR